MLTVCSFNSNTNCPHEHIRIVPLHKSLLTKQQQTTGTRTYRNLRQSCTHVHDQTCDQCTSLASALSDMEKLLGEIPFCNEDDRDEVFYLYRNAALAIRAWKCHLLRTVRQDQARFDALDLLDEQTVLLVNDWAMKFIPQKYRESQADWFGKKGISWHISVAYRKVDQQLQSQAFINLIQSCSQGSAAVVVILQHII